MSMMPAAVDYHRAFQRKLATWFGGIVRRGSASAVTMSTVTVATYDGTDMGSIARLRGPAIAAGETVYLLNVTGDPRHPGWLVLGAEGNGLGTPRADADARASVSYGGDATVLGSPLITFTGLNASRPHRVEAWATATVAPNSGQDCFMAVVIDGVAGTEAAQLSTSSKGGIGAGAVADLPAGDTSITVAVQLRTNPADAMTWTDLRLFATVQGT